MQTVMILHEVDDVDHWLSSPKRAEMLEPRGIKVRTFVDPEGGNRVGGIVEVPDMETLQAVLSSPEGVEAMQHDGVRLETVLVLVES